MTEQEKEEMKAFIRQVVREEVDRMLREGAKTRGWQPLNKPGPQEQK